jgi:hypothetical protein
MEERLEMQRQWRVLGKWRACFTAAAIVLLTTATSIYTVRAGDKGLSLTDLAGSMLVGKAVF